MSHGLLVLGDDEVACPDDLRVEVDPSRSVYAWVYEGAVWAVGTSHDDVRAKAYDRAKRLSEENGEATMPSIDDEGVTRDGFCVEMHVQLSDLEKLTAWLDAENAL